MDISKLTQETFQAWVPFDDEMEVLFDYVPRDELQILSKKATKINFVKHQRVEGIDPTEADKLLGRRAVKDWRPRPGKIGWTLKDEPFPYSPENCDLLMAKWHAFARFVNETCVDIDLLMEKEQEQIRKNSSSTSGQE